MFKIRYSMTEGMLRKVPNRTAALMRPHSMSARAKNRYGSTSNITSPMMAGSGMHQRYSPVWERAEDPTLAEDFLPADAQTQHKIFRNLLMFDAIAGPAIEYWRDMAFGNDIILSGINDDKVLKFYQDAIQACGIVTQMPMLLSDYLAFGKFVFHMLMDESRGYWTETIPHDLDYVSIKVSPIPSMDPLIDLQPNQEHRDWAVSQDHRVQQQRSQIDPVLIKLMAAGQPIPLAPENTMFLARRVHATDYYGTSFLTRIMPFKIYEKALLDASISGARRRAGPLWHITVWPDATDDEMSEVLDLFFAAEEDPIGGKVVTREGVTVTPVGGGAADFWKLSDEWAFLSEAKMRALGISESFLCLAGDTLIPTQEFGLVPIESLRDGDDKVQDLTIGVAGKSGVAKTSKWIYRGHTKTQRITTKLGYSIRTTPAHQILTLTKNGDLKWKSARNFGPGDLMCVNTKPCVRRTKLDLNLPDHVPGPLARNTKIPRKPAQMTPDLAFVLGLIVSEGCHDRYRVRITNSDQALIHRYSQCMQAIFDLSPVVSCCAKSGSDLVISGVATATTRDCYAVELNSRVVADWLTLLGLLPGGISGAASKQLSWSKEVPWCILQADADSQLAYLAAYLEGDGFINNAGCDLSIFSRSDKNLRQLQVLLASHGIVSKHMVKHHRLFISTTNARKLYPLVLPYLVTKKFSPAALDKPENFGNVLASVPAKFVGMLLASRTIRYEANGTWFHNDAGREIFIRAAGQNVTPFMGRTRFSYAAHKAGKYTAFLECLAQISSSTHAKLISLLNEEYYFDPVTEVSVCAATDVYDLSMSSGEEPAFVGNGLVVHNSGDANYNTMEVVLSTFLEKIRSVRAYFTKKIIVEKICRQLAQTHGFVHRSQAELQHRVRTGKKSRLMGASDPELLLPTVEWDKPLTPVADQEYLSILDSLEEKGFPIPIRMRAQVAGFDIDKALDSFKSDVETRKLIYEQKLRLKKLEDDFGVEGGAAGGGGEGAGGLEIPGLGGGGPELGGEGADLGGGGLEMPELGGELGGEAGGEELGGGGEAPAPAPGGAEAGPGGAAASGLKKRFSLSRPRTREVTADTREQRVVNVIKELELLPLWDRDGYSFGLSQRRVAKILDRVQSSDPDPRRRDELSKTLIRSLQRNEGLDRHQSYMVQYAAIRLNLLPPAALPGDAFELINRYYLDRMAQSGLNKSLTREITFLSRISEACGRKVNFDHRDVDVTMAMMRQDRTTPDNQLLTGVADVSPGPNVRVG